MKATRNGALAAVIVAACTLISLLIAKAFDSTEGLLGNINAYGSWADVILYLVLAYGVSKHSRVASILLLTTFLMVKLYLLSISSIVFLTEGEPPVIFIITSLIFIYFFAKAVQGSFAYHQIEKRINPGKYIRKVWHYFLGIPLALIGIIFFIVFCIALMDGGLIALMDGGLYENENSLHLPPDFFQY